MHEFIVKVLILFNTCTILGYVRHSWAESLSIIPQCLHIDTYSALTVNYTNYTQSRSINTIMYTMAVNYIQSLNTQVSCILWLQIFISLKFASHQKLTSHCKCTACSYLIWVHWFQVYYCITWSRHASCSQSFSPWYCKGPLPVHSLPI